MPHTPLHASLCPALRLLCQQGSVMAVTPGRRDCAHDLMTLVKPLSVMTISEQMWVFLQLISGLQLTLSVAAVFLVYQHCTEQVTASVL